LSNTGEAGSSDLSLHPDDAGPYLSADIYRLDATVTGEGWTARILNALTAVGPGQDRSVTVYVSRGTAAAGEATLNLSATSESDPSTTAIATVRLRR
jgi:hypothetical protein